MFESYKLNISVIESAGSFARFVVEPLEPGFGVTIGNALRRTLLSSIPGASVTWMKIDGVAHEFSPIPYVKEDVIEFMMNVKMLRIQPLSHQAGKLFLEVSGEGVVQAADIKPSADFRIANPELYLATVDSPEGKLYVEFNVEMGKGYVQAKSPNGLPEGALPMDAIFSPVRKVNFSIDSIRPGQEGSQERLNMEVWTDGTLAPEEVVSQSANILLAQFSSFKGLSSAGAQGEAQGISLEKYSKIPLEELNLSVRPYNSLKRAGIDTLAHLLERSAGGVPALPGLGAKSREEVEQLLANLRVPVAFQEEEGGISVSPLQPEEGQVE
ncbi:MAG: DNA-directed RNA polymerase subunit alpha [Dehalococcoidia bacterium]|nr:DNA-directed RNA polymerase subunit alpha [Dehalococcoidia bacterium]